MTMEDTKFSVEDYKSISTPSNLNIPEVNNKHTEPSILEVCEAEFDSCEGIADFYEKFRGSVCKNLKKKGYRDGDLELLQDEILSPTFEEVILLWCLDKVQPNLSRKIRPEFNDKLGTGVPMIQLKDEIFKFCAQDSILNPKFKNAKLEPGGPALDIKEENHELPSYANDVFPILLDDNLINNIIEVQMENATQEEDYNDETWWQEDDLDEDENYKPKKPGRKRSKGENITKYNAPVSCDLCGKTYAGLRRLNEHRDRMHNKPPGMEEEKKPEKKKIIRPKKKITFSCKECDVTFDTAEERKAHRLQAHKPEVKKEMCPYCGKMIKVRSKKRHLLSHTSDGTQVKKEVKKYVYNQPAAPCDICGKTLTGKRGYTEHMNAFHNESAIRCELCNYPLENQEKYEAHMKKHEEDPNYRKSKFKRTIKCDVCKRCFNTDEEFKKHICKHFTCEVCDESFLHRRNLEVHRSSHEGKEVFSCDICEALFNKRKALYHHKRSTHELDKRKYKCDVCGKFFLNPSKVEAHRLQHTDEKPLKCDQCPKRFRYSYQMKLHIRKTHSENHGNTVPCISCDKTFRDVINMKKHRESGLCENKKLLQVQANTAGQFEDFWINQRSTTQERKPE